jgi:tripartite-type tricarboxylate transporter receptor subunit TctC
MNLFFKAMAVCTAALVATTGFADTYPSRPIKLVVPFPPGQSADTLMRIVGEGVAIKLKQPVVIDNRPGAGGVIGTQYVVSQPADGYTIMMGGSGPMTISPTLQPSVAKYDAVKNFSPISGIARIAQVIVVSNDSQIKNLQGLVSAAKQRPGTVTFGSSGNGTTQHLFMEMLSSTAQIKMSHVPYKGSAPALTDLIGGQIDTMSDTITAMLPLIRSGKVRPIAVTSAKRWPTLPDVPTVAEQGYPTYSAEGWISLLAPAGTPADVVAELEGAVKQVLADSSTRAKFTDLGFLELDLDHGQMQDFLRSETVKFKKVIDTAGIKVD